MLYKGISYTNLIKTLECLKKVLTIEDETECQDSIPIEKLERYLETLCNIPNASQIVTNWINGLIDEYNNKHFEPRESLCKTVKFDIHNASSIASAPYRSTNKALTWSILISPSCFSYISEKWGCENNVRYFWGNKNTWMFKKGIDNRRRENFKWESLLSSSSSSTKEHILIRVSNYNGNEILYLLGFFNFRIQHYDAAITYLKPCVENYLEKISNDESINLYVNSLIYLVESYENKSDLDLEQLTNPSKNETPVVVKNKF